MQDNKLIHVPLSLITFDENIKNKYDLCGENNLPTSHVDIFNTIINITNTSRTNNNFLMNLLAPEKKERYILAEQNLTTFPFGQIRMFDSDTNINIHVKSSDYIHDICPRHLIVNEVSEQEYTKYFQYKKKLNEFYSLEL